MAKVKFDSFEEASEFSKKIALETGTTSKMIKEGSIWCVEDARISFNTKEFDSSGKLAEKDYISENVGTHKFDLLIFDLDDTLIKSSHLDNFRGRVNIGNNDPAYLTALTAAANKLSFGFSPDLLKKIRERFYPIKVAIFTKAPRIYCETILRICYPDFKWDCIITFEDVKKTKPSPEGIYKIANQFGLSNFTRIMYVGDDKKDVVAAYQAGCFAVLSRMCWKTTNWQKEKEIKTRIDHCNSIEFLPDAVIDFKSQLIKLIETPSDGLPALESWMATWGTDVKPKMRVESFHFFNHLVDEKPTPYVKVNILGRYFATHHDDNYDHTDFTQKMQAHSLTRCLLDAKKSSEYPDSVVSCCVDYISNIADKVDANGSKLIICTIPARTGKSLRLENLLDRISNAISSSNVSIIFNRNLLKYKDGAVENKSLNNRKRYINIRDHLLVTDKIEKARCIMVLDDITTSGATFFYADQYLKNAGADKVHCVALAKNVAPSEDL